MLRLMEAHPTAVVEGLLTAGSNIIRHAWRRCSSSSASGGRPAADVPASHRDASRTRARRGARAAAVAA